MQFEPPREFVPGLITEGAGMLVGVATARPAGMATKPDLHIEIEHGMVIATLQEWYAQHHPRVPRHPGHAVEEPFAAPCRR